MGRRRGRRRRRRCGGGRRCGVVGGWDIGDRHLIGRGGGRRGRRRSRGRRRGRGRAVRRRCSGLLVGRRGRRPGHGGHGDGHGPLGRAAVGDRRRLFGTLPHHGDEQGFLAQLPIAVLVFRTEQHQIVGPVAQVLEQQQLLL